MNSVNSDFDRYQEAIWGGTTNLRPYNHPVVKAFASSRIRQIETMLTGWEPKTALDVGCGDGFGMYSMRSLVKEIYGCDKSPAMLAANPANPLRLKQCDAYALPYEGATFDLVYCWELLHHIGNPQMVVSEMIRVAKRCVILCEPNCLNPAMALFGLLYRHERGLLRFTPSYTGRLLRDSGLTNIQNVTVGWFTPNRTPKWLANFLSMFPYKIPLLGLYTITLGFKETNSTIA